MKGTCYMERFVEPTIEQHSYCSIRTETLRKWAPNHCRNTARTISCVGLSCDGDIMWAWPNIFSSSIYHVNCQQCSMADQPRLSSPLLQGRPSNLGYLFSVLFVGHRMQADVWRSLGTKQHDRVVLQAFYHITHFWDAWLPFNFSTNKLMRELYSLAPFLIYWCCWLFCCICLSVLFKSFKNNQIFHYELYYHQRRL